MKPKSLQNIFLLVLSCTIMLSSCDDSSESNSDSGSQFDGTYHRLVGYDSTLTISGNTLSITNYDSIDDVSTREIKYEYNYTFTIGNDFDGGKQVTLTITSFKITLLTDNAVEKANNDIFVPSSDPAITDWKKGEPRDVYPDSVGDTDYQILKKTGKILYLGSWKPAATGSTFPSLWQDAYYQE